MTRSALPPFAGIALADILANGVAVLILLVIISISVKYVEERKQIEQVDEVSLVLSRDLAVSMVMNNLSASAPALLHDYHRSPLDLQLHPAIMPILEIYSDHVRNFYDGNTWLSDELLLADNRLDEYLSRLSALQKQRMRVDIYDIQLFYITMSILKKHAIAPRHWHFMTANQAHGSNTDHAGINDRSNGVAARGATSEQSGEAMGGSNESEEWIEEGTAEHSTSAAENGLDLERLYGNGSVPSSVEILPSGQSGYLLPSENPPPLGQSEHSVTFDAQKRPLLNRAQFRLAGDLATFIPVKGGDIGQPLLLEDVLTALFGLMNHVQGQLDEGLSPTFDLLRFHDDLHTALLSIPQQISESDKEVVTDLVNAYAALWVEESDNLLDTDEAIRSTDGRRLLQVRANDLLITARVISHSSHRPLFFLPAPTAVKLALARYPGIVEGQISQVGRESFIIMPTLQQEGYRWRAVTMVSAQFDDFLFGLLYSNVVDTARGSLQLLIPADENQVHISGYPLHSEFPSIENRVGNRLFSWHIAVAVVLLFGIAVRFFLRRRTWLVVQRASQ